MNAPAASLLTETVALLQEDDRRTKAVALIVREVEALSRERIAALLWAVLAETYYCGRTAACAEIVADMSRPPKA
jgi:hypothetical protein